MAEVIGVSTNKIGILHITTLNHPKYQGKTFYELIELDDLTDAVNCGKIPPHIKEQMTHGRFSRHTTETAEGTDIYVNVWQ